MNSSEEQKGAVAPGTGGVPSQGETALGPTPKDHEDGFPHEPENESSVSTSAPLTPVVESDNRAVARTPGSAGGGKRPPTPPSGGNDADDEDDRMLRMSFLEH